MTEEIFPVEITEDGQTIEITIENQIIKGTAETIKVDADYPDHKLSGAVFEVYADVDNNGEFNADIDKMCIRDRIKSAEEPMFTLTAQDRHGVFFGGRIRRLTPKECLRLQGWRDEQIDRVLPIQSDAQLYKQAGNGVTVTVVEAIGKRLALAHREVNAID